MEYIYTCITGPDGHRASSGGADDFGVESEGGSRHHEAGGSVEAVRRLRRDRHEAAPRRCSYPKVLAVNGALGSSVMAGELLEKAAPVSGW